MNSRLTIRYKRKWKYNVEYNIWLSSETDINLNQLDNISNNSKSSNYMFFNPTEWEIQSFVYGNLNNNFLSETDLMRSIKNLNSNN